jgi:hypothetical protein
MTNSNTQLGYIPNSPEGVIVRLNQVREQIAELKKLEDQVKESLIEAFRVQLTAAYREKPEPFGVINITEGEYKISFTTPKKVKWEQEGLAELYKDGAPVEVEYSVKETVYKDLDKEGKKIMNKFRTVEPGSVAIKIERV